MQPIERMFGESPTEPADGTPVTNRRLLAHATLLWVCLLVLMPIVGVQRAPLIPDEGALVMQLDTLEQHRSWTATYPLADLDPDGRHVAIGGAAHSEGTIAPYPVRPVYVLLNALPAWFTGIWGPTAIGLLATALTALFAALITHELARSAALPALWLTGIGTPLLFHGYILQGHTLGSACVAAALFVTVRAGRALPVAPTSSLLVGLVLMFGATIRRETLFVAGGIALWALWNVIRSRDWSSLHLGLAAVVGAGAGFLLDRMMTSGLIDGGRPRNAPTTTSDDVSFVASRLASSYNSLVRTGYGSYEIIDMVAMVALVVTVFGAIQLRRRGETPLFVVGLTLSGAFALGRLATPSDWAPIVPGLLFASPILVAGLLLVRWKSLDHAIRSLLVVVTLVAVTATLATQYLTGGWEWGARFLAIALPALAVLSAVGWAATLEQLGATERKVVGLAAVAALTASSVLAISAQREGRDHVEEMLDVVVAAGTGPENLIVSTEKSVGRLDTSQLDPAAEHRWALTPVDHLGDFITSIDENTAIDRLVIVTDPIRQVGGVDMPPGWVLSGPTVLPSIRFELEMWIAER
jgi:hypothetical protein